MKGVNGMRLGVTFAKASDKLHKTHYTKPNLLLPNDDG